MTLRILVAGSSHRRYDSTNPGSRDKFEEFCSSLGKSLAQRHHQIIVLSDCDQHADPHILQGYVGQASIERNLPSVRVSYGTVADPENRVAIKFQKMRSAYSSNLTFDDFNAAGDYPFNRVGIVKDADAIILVGGGEGTRILTEIAYALKKPIIPVEAFGGMAERVWHQQKAYIEEVGGLASLPLVRYYGDIYHGRTDQVVQIVEKVVQAPRVQQLIA